MHAAVSNHKSTAFHVTKGKGEKKKNMMQEDNTCYENTKKYSSTTYCVKDFQK
jgi:hypothetical protein